jgi:hypothetical protein
MARFQNWPSRMDEFLRAHAVTEFAWGIWDCALMAAAHLDNITGSEHYVTRAGHYDSPDSAADYLTSLGVAGLDGLATQILGDRLVNKKMAQRGDIVTFDTTLGPALGVVDLSGMKIIGLDPSEAGFIRIPLALSTAAWRV